MCPRSLLFDTALTCGFVSYRYWKLNPGQDETDYRESPQDPVNVIRSRSLASSRGSRELNREGKRHPRRHEGNGAMNGTGAIGDGYRPNDSAV